MGYLTVTTTRTTEGPRVLLMEEGEEKTAREEGATDTETEAEAKEEQGEEAGAMAVVAHLKCIILALNTWRDC